MAQQSIDPAGWGASLLNRATLPLLFFSMCAAAWFTYWRSISDLSPTSARASGQSLISTASAEKPPLLLFTSEADSACRDFKHDVFDDGDVQAYVNANFVPVIVDISKTKAPELATDVTLPSMILLDPTGQEALRGAPMEKTSLLQWLESARRSRAALVSR